MKQGYCGKCPKRETCTETCQKVEAELSYAVYGRKRPESKTRRRKEIPIVYESQLGGPEHAHYYNIVYGAVAQGGE